MANEKGKTVEKRKMKRTVRNCITTDVTQLLCTHLKLFVHQKKNFIVSLYMKKRNFFPSAFFSLSHTRKKKRIKRILYSLKI